jgi:PAS domain S-box-containing protein
MLETWVPPVVALAYVVLLFLVAYVGDRLHQRGTYVPTPIVYSLALGVYCTSWTFFGAVGMSATRGWDFLTIYLGPIIVFLMMTRLPARIVEVSKRQSITSVADFIASRYGKAQGIAALASVMALVTVLPYIALQLKAVSGSYSLITGGPGMSVLPRVSEDTGLVAAAVLAVFTILFGTRQVDSTESHRGMVLAVAFESAVKLVAFVAVGLWVVYGLFDGPQGLITASRANETVMQLYSSATIGHSFLVLTVISMLAILCLPRQFHVAVVENTSPRDLAMARWAFPAYLAVFTVFVVPIAAAGIITQGPGSVADGYVLSLPLAADQPGLALLAFLGGFSAATGMVIVATIACSTMLCNEIVMPALVKLRGEDVSRRPDLARLLIRIRRVLIVLILALSWLSYRVIGMYGALASIGLLSFALAAQFGPAMIGGLYWRRATRAGAIAGMWAGFIVWVWTLLVPAFAQTGWLPARLLTEGPFGLAWLSPYALFGATELDPVTHGVFWSLGINIALFVGVSLYTSPRLMERRQAAAFVSGGDAGSASTALLPVTDRLRGSAKVGDLRILAERFIGREKAAAAFEEHLSERGLSAAEGQRADAQVLELTERLLSGAMGASAARTVLISALKGAELQIEDVASIVGEASQVSRFNRDLLETTLENVAEGISVIDADLRLVAWNRRYAELFDYPDELLRIGTPVETLIRYNARLGRCGPGRVEEHVGKRMAHFDRGGSHVFQRTRDDGSVTEMRVNPLPGGGYVASFSDITEHKRTELALRESESNIRIYTDNVPVLIAYVDRHLVYRFVNKAYEQAVGLDRDAICGRHVNEILGRESFIEREAHMEGALAGIRQSFEVSTTDGDGRLRYAEATYIPQFDESGKVQGFFALFHDITERRRAQQGLKEAYDTLEQRVQDRTRELSEVNRRLRSEIELRNRIERALRDAKADAEAANISKTRFLAAASHDLLQPLNAARLFTSALGQGEHDPRTLRAVERIDSSLRAAEELLMALLDISKLDAGALEPRLDRLPHRRHPAGPRRRVRHHRARARHQPPGRAEPRDGAQRPPVPAPHPAEFPVQRAALHEAGPGADGLPPPRQFPADPGARHRSGHFGRAPRAGHLRGIPALPAPRRDGRQGHGPGSGDRPAHGARAGSPHRGAVRARSRLGVLGGGADLRRRSGRAAAARRGLAGGTPGRRLRAVRGQRAQHPRGHVAPAGRVVLRSAHRHRHRQRAAGAGAGGPPAGPAAGRLPPRRRRYRPEDHHGGARPLGRGARRHHHGRLRRAGARTRAQHGPRDHAQAGQAGGAARHHEPAAAGAAPVGGRGGAGRAGGSGVARFPVESPRAGAALFPVDRRSGA